MNPVLKLESAWLQRWRVNCYELLLKREFNFKLRHCISGMTATGPVPAPVALINSTRRPAAAAGPFNFTTGAGGAPGAGAAVGGAGEAAAGNGGQAGGSGFESWRSTHNYVPVFHTPYYAHNGMC